MKAESEESATQAMAFIAIVIITFGLMVMNVSGALASSVGKGPLEMTIRVALAVILAGAELLAAVALVRVMLAPNWWRKVAGSIIFCGLAWACIQNGKRAVHLIYPEFAESSALLEAKAGIAGEEAALVATARNKAIDATPEELARVRTEIAAIKAEQQLMASQSPEKIKEAQALLISQGKYFGRVDGLRETLTEAAMRSRGEELAQQLTTLNLREEALAAGAVTAAAGVTAGQNAAVLQADLADRARKAKAATIWLEVMLWVFEAARSFGLWALVTTITARKRVEEAVSSEVPAGHVRVEMPEEEWAAYQKAKSVHDNIQTGAKKGARTRRQGNKIEQSKQYAEERISEFMVLKNQGMSTAQIAAKFGLTPATIELQYGAYMTAEEHAALFGPGYQPEPEQEPPVAVSDSPQDDADGADDTPPDEPEAETEIAEPEVDDTELDIPPEPREYGIDVWKPQQDDEEEKRDELV
jgi:hypothetical protein